MAYLPDDILYMVCTLLWHQRDFDTLYNCMCSGKQLAAIAVIYLYRMQHVAPIPNDHNKLVVAQEAHGPTLMKWAGRWRTILLSSLGKTLYPYSQYICGLNLRDLERLLTESIVGDRTSKVLFQGELKQFAVTAIDKHLQFNATETVNRIGEAITKQTPLLEVLTGTILSGALSGWIPHLPRLTHLKLYLDTAVNGNGSLIHFHCPSFKELDLADRHGDNSDQDLALFLNDLRPQSLESFKTSNYRNFGLKSIQALKCHSNSLNELKLHQLGPSIIPQLSLLKGCTNLVSLSLDEMDMYPPGLKNSHSDAVIEMVSWLKECTKLRTLACTGFFSAPALVTLIMSENSIRLTSLEYEGSVWLHDQSVHPQFHQALANQTSLQSLRLDGDLVWNALDAEGLVGSLSKLVNLRDLRLGEISSSFDDQHVVQLISGLPKLEVCSMSGYGLTDAIWGEFGSLRSLRRLELDSLTDTTRYGILGFIEKLGPGNKGLVLSLTNVSVNSGFFQDVWDWEDLIQETIARNIEGRYEIKLHEDAHAEIEHIFEHIFEDDDTSDLITI